MFYFPSDDTGFGSIPRFCDGPIEGPRRIRLCTGARCACCTITPSLVRQTSASTHLFYRVSLDNSAGRLCAYRFFLRQKPSAPVSRKRKSELTAAYSFSFSCRRFAAVYKIRLSRIQADRIIFPRTRPAFLPCAERTAGGGDRINCPTLPAPAASRRTHRRICGHSILSHG